MSGAVAAHAAYNGSGTQGLAVTNKIHDDDGDVMSVFWNKNDTTRQLLYGSSIIEIPSSGASNISYGGSRLFTVNNDIDCLGDLYLQLGVDTPQYSFTGRGASASVDITIASDGTATTANGTWNEFSPDTTFTFKISDGTNTLQGSVQSDGNGVIPANTAATVVVAPAAWTVGGAVVVTIVENISVEAQPFILQSLIERVEVQVGTQIWQTIENQDLRVVNSTELSPDAFYSASSTSGGGVAWLVIPSLTKTLGPALGKFTNQTEDGYPMAAAPHQSVKIKVTLVEKLTQTLSFALSTPALDTEVLEAAFLVPTENAPYRLKLGGSITANPSLGGPVELQIRMTNPTLTTDPAAVSEPTSLNLFAKQQIMCNEEREQMKAMPMGLPKRIKMTQNSSKSVVHTPTGTLDLDLDHFSLYGSHIIISVPAVGSAGIDVLNKSTVELLLNSSSFSGKLPLGLLKMTGPSMGLFTNEYGASGGTGETRTYVFPLASRAYGGSSVPLNRFDNIRLKIHWATAPAGRLIFEGAGTVNITCVGETTALYKGGAASLAMY